LLELMLSKRSRKNTKCVNAANEELTAAKHKLKLKLFKNIAAADMKIETTNEGTKILATVHDKPMTIFESSIRRNLKLNDEEGISSLPDAELFENLALMGATRIAHSKALPTASDKPASLFRDDSQGEAFPTVSSLEAGQDRENIIKTSALPYDSTPRVTSLAADKGNLGISSLKARIKLIEDRDKGTTTLSGDDAPIMGRSLETGEEACVEKSTEQRTVSVPPVGEIPTVGVPTGSGLVPNVSAIFTTASVVTPYSRRKEMEEEMARDAQKMNEQIARDAEIARIHVEKELQMLINGLDRNNEFIAKHLQEYEQSEAELTIGEKIDLINELVKYQDHHSKILEYQAQQSKPLSKKQQREFYMSVLKSHSRWKTKHFRGMTLEEIREKFIHGNAKRIKTSEDVSEEDLKEMMQLVPVEEVYVEALQLPEPERTLNRRLRQRSRRVPYDQRNNPPQHPRIFYLPILNINYFRHFLDILRNYDPIDDELMWAADCVVALTLDFAIIIPKIANEFAIKVIRVKQKQLDLGVGTKRMTFNIESAIKHSYSNDDTCFSISVIDEILKENFDALLDEGSKILYSIAGTILEEEIFSEFDKFITMTADENYDSESDTEEPQFEKITINTDYKIQTSLEEPPMDLELKPHPHILEYVFLKEPSFLHVIISPKLSSQNKSKLVSVLKNIRKHFLGKQQIFLVSVQLSIGGIIIVTNKNDELVQIRTVTGWRVCIDYCKLNEATAKDHFPLPFMDQMLEMWIPMNRSLTP
nr:DNA-directed DNA polymerase [Tanacetum cinerariifolium]